MREATFKTKPGRIYKLDRKSRALQKLYNVFTKAPFLPSSRRYHITISHDPKFIWFRVAKVGTQTIYLHLKKNKVLLDAEYPSFVRYPSKLFVDYFKFAFVRNPWDRFISSWRHCVFKNNTFDFDEVEHEKMRVLDNFVNFVASFNIEDCNRHIQSQSSLIDLNHIDYLGRMETFDDDANYIFQRLGLDPSEIVPKNMSSNREPYHNYFNNDLSERVAQIYRKDIQVLGYKFEPPS